MNKMKNYKRVSKSPISLRTDVNSLNSIKECHLPEILKKLVMSSLLKSNYGNKFTNIINSALNVSKW